MTYPPNYPPGPPAHGGEHPQGTTILVLGILSLVLCAPLGIAAWIMGKKAIAEATAMGASNTSLIKAGYVCGIIASCLLLVGVVFAAFALIAGVLTSTAGY